MNPNTSSPRLAALRHRDFRLLWVGQLFSTIGSQMQLIAVNWHVYKLLPDQTYNLSLFGHDIALGAEALGLGALGLVRIVPIILLALLGGMLADSRDRRTLMLWTQSTLALLSALLAAFTVTGHASLAAIYLLTAAGAAAAFDQPARAALIPNLVPREHLSNAISLNVTLW